jgi:hypothetical protein
MPKCPHCGEQVNAGQETCFACGRKVRARAYRQKRPLNSVVFIIAGVLLAGAIVGIVLVGAGNVRGAKRNLAEQRQAEIRDSVRQAMKAKRDTMKARSENVEISALGDEIDKLDQRFNNVRQQVVKDDKPGPEQTRIIGQIRTQIARLRGISSSFELATGAKADSLKQQVRDGERVVRALICDLGRAPQN